MVLEEAHTVIPEWNLIGVEEKTAQALVNAIGHPEILEPTDDDEEGKRPEGSKSTQNQACRKQLIDNTITRVPEWRNG